MLAAQPPVPAGAAGLPELPAMDAAVAVPFRTADIPVTETGTIAMQKNIDIVVSL